MLNVVHIDLGRELRGGQRQVLLLHRELVRAAVGSVVVARAGSPLAGRCAEEGLPVLAVSGRAPWQLVHGPLRRMLRGASIVHSHDAHAATLAAVACRLEPGLRWVAHRRVSYTGAHQIARRLKYGRVAQWIVVSADIRTRLVAQGVDADRCSVVPSAVDLGNLRGEAARADGAALRDELHLADDSPVIGVVGALTAQKGHRALLEAVPRILEAHPECRVVVIGSGPLQAELETLARRLGIGHAVRFLGFRDDVAALTTVFTVAASPSVDGEGSPAALKEPMALGVPVVASDIPGHRETVGDAGELVAAGDSAALASALVALLGDGERRRRLADRGGQWVQRFSPERTLAAVLQVYRKVVGAE